MVVFTLVLGTLVGKLYLASAMVLYILSAFCSWDGGLLASASTRPILTPYTRRCLRYTEFYVFLGNLFSSRLTPILKTLFGKLCSTLDLYVRKVQTEAHGRDSCLAGDIQKMIDYLQVYPIDGKLDKTNCITVFLFSKNPENTDETF